MSIETKLVEIAENVPKVYEAGKKSEWDFFWDGLQHNGKGTADYRNMFFYWSNDIYKPKYPIYSTKTNMSGVFQNARIENTLVDLDFSATTTLTGAFGHCSKLHTIPKMIVAEQNTWASAFASCSSLANITVEGKFGNSVDFSACPLTQASLISVIGALSKTATGQTITLNKTAVDNAFNTATWKSITDGIPNWTFTLI